MAHQAQRQFFEKVRIQFLNKFSNCNVLDIGSLDINGNNRYLFENFQYTGVDVGEGNNVDVVCEGHLFNPNKQYDIVISSECFEHDQYYKETILNCIRLTKSNGIFTFTCASTGRAEHGTINSLPQDAPLLMNKGTWSSYYKNLTEQDIREIVNLDDIFDTYYFEYNQGACDLYFWGLKK